MLCLTMWFGKQEKFAAVHRYGTDADSTSLRAKRSNPESDGRSLDCLVATAPRNDGEHVVSTSRAEFQTLKSGRNAQAHLALQAERLKRDRILRAADQRIAAGTDTDRGAALRTGIIAREIARPELGDR